MGCPGALGSDIQGWNGGRNGERTVELSLPLWTAFPESCPSCFDPSVIFATRASWSSTSGAMATGLLAGLTGGHRISSRPVPGLSPALRLEFPGPCSRSLRLGHFPETVVLPFCLALRSSCGLSPTLRPEVVGGTGARRHLCF